jgi:hypothetical protein
MVTKSLKDRMFRPEVREAISESIREAVAASEAAKRRSVFESVFSQLDSPEFQQKFQETIERDRQAGLEWRRDLVSKANAKVTPNEQELVLQQEFIATGLPNGETWKMVCDLCDKAGVKRPEPTPHDMGLD